MNRHHKTKTVIEQINENGMIGPVKWDTMPHPKIVILGERSLIVPMRKKAIVVVAPEIMSGTPCFAGTRVPVRSLLDYIEGGDTLDEFSEQFPTVSRKQAVAFLEQASESLVATA